MKFSKFPYFLKVLIILFSIPLGMFYVIWYTVTNMNEVIRAIEYDE